MKGFLERRSEKKRKIPEQQNHKQLATHLKLRAIKIRSTRTWPKQFFKKHVDWPRNFILFYF
jgi:hypothetical protein